MEVPGSPITSCSSEQDLSLKKPMSEKLKYQHISDEIRQKIVTKFLVEGKKLIDISKEFDVNYSSAKTIIKVFREQKRIKKILPNQRHLRINRNSGDGSDTEDYEKVVKNLNAKAEFKFQKRLFSVNNFSKANEFERKLTKKICSSEEGSDEKTCRIRCLNESKVSKDLTNTQIKFEESNVHSTQAGNQVNRMGIFRENVLAPQYLFQETPVNKFTGTFNGLSNLYFNQPSTLIPTNQGLQNFYLKNLTSPVPTMKYNLPSMTGLTMPMFGGYFIHGCQ
eukprot:CAMPEP_0176441208 /NCGR_PEP_ID=MMETSP0127-20121128/21056_1 /TAXON_ID=938130 /ORGANISM="Platyophrya macrostoma, Strain WH" /LENGTH=278 /DNA_ID=CAMNT_0017825933 /DNA_START=33 /DNA_END=869 /DNA_ORIENTATION=+